MPDGGKIEVGIDDVRAGLGRISRPGASGQLRPNPRRRRGRRHSRRHRSTGSPSPSSPPRRPARAPASACRWSRLRPAVGRQVAHRQRGRAKARRSSCSCPRPPRRPAGRDAQSAPPKPFSIARRCCWSTMTRRSARSWASSCATWDSRSTRPPTAGSAIERLNGNGVRRAADRLRHAGNERPRHDPHRAARATALDASAAHDRLRRRRCGFRCA